MKKIYTIVFIIIFSIGANAQYTKLMDFANDTVHGYSPNGSLMLNGNFLYGMTQKGGAHDTGVVFKIKTDGSTYSKLLDFNGTNGMFPFGSLITDGTYLYGMTSGVNISTLYEGNIFKIKLDGTGDTTLLNFSFPNGRLPYGSLFYDGTFLYGMTTLGGVNGSGNVFKIMPDGTNYSDIHDFVDTVNAALGGSPHASLISDGTYLYGTTAYGGTSDNGTLFKIKPDGSGFVKLFDCWNTDGIGPFGDLVFDTPKTFLYGTAESVGTNNKGNLFKIKPNGTGFDTLINFTGANGATPCGSLLYDGTFLYGMTYAGGPSNLGVLFKIKPDGTGYDTLLNFVGTNGYQPLGSLVTDGTFLYGMTTSTVFKYNPYCTAVTNTQSVVICPGQNVTVGTHSYTTGGIYKDTLRAASTCDSILTTNVIISPPASVSDSLYKDVLPFTWNIAPHYSPKIINAKWYWGDGTDTLALYPSHTYPAAGNYNICVTAYSSCGDSASTCNMDSIYKTTNGNAMIYVHVVNGSLSDVIQWTENNQVEIYPNPSSRMFQITSDRLNITSTEIFNVLGEKVYSSQLINSKSQVINIDASNGIYFLHVKTELGETVKKIIISK